MELKTQVTAQEGRQDLTITREFDLPVELLFKAYTEADLLSQWMGTKVVKLENKKFGAWAFETSNAEGKVVFSAHGAIHDFVVGQKIIRTFEMDNVPVGVQLEFLEFESLSHDASKLTIHSIYQTTQQRDKVLAMPFAQGINMAHNRLQDIAAKLF